jgi:predicted aspartyl protease
LRVRGHRGLFQLVYIDVEIKGTNPQFDSPMTLAIDTGCTKTVIMDKDAEVLGLNYHKLDRVTKGIVGIGGKSRGWLLGDITIIFPTADQESLAWGPR